MPEQTAVWVKCLNQWWPGTLKFLGKGYYLVILDDGTEQWVPLKRVRRRTDLAPHPLIGHSTKTEIATDAFLLMTTYPERKNHLCQGWTGPPVEEGLKKFLFMPT